jgi:hypothetical protein
MPILLIRREWSVRQVAMAAANAHNAASGRDRLSVATLFLLVLLGFRGCPQVNFDY